ncbi:protein kinase [Nocardia sp. NPDC057668]|uniref:serine/threonine-protein kinase n=1 Tax=Nocardia sp. NPDC057668 TaxID=3346202 RepID=UPI00366A926D
MTGEHRTIAVGTRFGPYRLDRLIGRGGMGEVYQAYDTIKDRTVAIKVLPERLAHDPVYRQRFQRESRAAARLREAHVIPIHDYGEIEGRLFIDMRLVDGEDLRDLLDRAGPGSPERAVGIVEQLAAALDAAHADGLLHRDVKPDNILLTRDGFAYLVDFGIAQSAGDEGLTTDGAAVGSFRYMAPERFSARDFTPAADIYGVACVLFECLTGARPFTGDTNVQLMRAHLFDTAPAPSALRPGIPAALDAVVARGLAKNPADRFRSAGELAAEARAALTTPARSTSARPHPTSVRPDSPAPQPDQPMSGRPGDPAQPGRPGHGTNPTAAQTFMRPGASGSTPKFTAAQGVVAPGLPSSAANLTAGQSSTRPDSPAPANPGTTPAAPVPAGSTGSTPADQPPHPGRTRRILTLLGVFILVAASLGFAGWAVTRPGLAGTPVPDNTALNGPDVELLSIAAGAGYKRVNCQHVNTDNTTTAVVFCAANPDASAPTAQFWRFRTVEQLRDYYTQIFLGTFRGTNCPHDPAGRDGVSLGIDGKAAGRQTCFADRTVYPDAPQPSLAVTNESALALAVFSWARPSESALRDYVAKNHHGQFVAPEYGLDPDFFTDADRDLLTRAEKSYTRANCVHSDPPVGAATSVLVCSGRVGSPFVQILGLPDERTTAAIYQADLAQFPGRACGGGASPDAEWRKAGAEVGRFLCYTDSSYTPAKSCLLAAHNAARLIYVICAQAADDPENGPKTEAELQAWFLRNFG